MTTKKSGARSAKKAKAPSDAAAHNVTLADHEKRITALEDSPPQLGALCEDMRSHISFLAEKIAAMQESGNRQHLELKQAMHAELAAMALIVRDVADGQASLADGQASLAEGQAKLASRMDKLETAMVRLEDRLTGLEGRTSGVETAVREFARGREDHARRLEKLERAEG